MNNKITALGLRHITQPSVYSIIFWITIIFLIRLIGITNPPLELMHHWRQITGLMVARNFLQVEPSIFYPRVDDLHNGEGIIGMEFPILNYLHFLVSKIFTYDHWYGRLINLLVSSIGMYAYYRIVQFFFSRSIAFWATILLIFSIWFSFSRKMMPDTFAASLMLIGIYYGILYFKKSKSIYLLFYLLMTCAGLLSKIPFLFYLLIFLPFFFENYSIKTKFYFLLVSCIPLILAFLWYYIWNPYLVNQYGNFYNFGYTLSHGFLDIMQNWQKVCIRFIYHSFYGFLLFLLFFLGFITFIKKRSRKLIIVSLIFFPAFFVFMCKAGYLFYQHNYYIIPIVPVMSLIAAYGLLQIKKRWIFALIIIGGISESLINQHKDFFINDSEMYKLRLSKIANQISSHNDLIAINGNGNPQLIYFTNRKGWTASNYEILDSVYLEEIVRNGCRYLFIDRKTFSQEIDKKIIYLDNDFIVYSMY